MRDPSAITLTRTDITLDHSQEAEKVCTGILEQRVGYMFWRLARRAVMP